MFIKKTPQEIAGLLLMEENADLCTIEDYMERFVLPPPFSIKEGLQNELISQGLVAPEYFGKSSE